MAVGCGTLLKEGRAALPSGISAGGKENRGGCPNSEDAECGWSSDIQQGWAYLLLGSLEISIFSVRKETLKSVSLKVKVPCPTPKVTFLGQQGKCEWPRYPTPSFIYLT